MFLKITLQASVLVFAFTFFMVIKISAQDTLQVDVTSPANKQALLQKFMQLPAKINNTDNMPIILKKLSAYLKAYQPKAEYPDDKFAKAANWQALLGVQSGGYGIGGVLYETKTGKILARAHNDQIQKNHSDLHGEMSLMDKFENDPINKKYRTRYVCKDGLTVFSSAEPCPMCFIRLASAQVDTKFATSGPDDGMVNRVACLPTFWRELAAKKKCEAGKCSPEMQLPAHCLFFSFMLDNRHVMDNL